MEQCAPVNRRHWATRDGRSEVPEGDHAHCGRQVGDDDVVFEGGGDDGVAPVGAQLVGGLATSWLLGIQPLVGPSLPLASLQGQVRSLSVLSRTVGVKTWGALWMLSLTEGELMVTVFSVCFLSYMSSGPMMV